MLMAILALTGFKAHALSLELHDPEINFAKGYNPQKAHALLAVLRDKRWSFHDGIESFWPPDWATTLSYGGDAAAFQAFLEELERVPGFRVNVSFSCDLSKEAGSALTAGSWWVKYSQVTPDTVTVRVNLAAKELGGDHFEIELPALWLPMREQGVKPVANSSKDSRD
jgi:hypothetical protein